MLLPGSIQRAVGALEVAQVRRFVRSAVSIVARTPVLVLQTTGRRTGAARSTVLAYHREVDGSLLIVGGAAGQRRLPDWVANLRADRSAAITLDRTRVGVTSSELGGPERQEVWRRLVGVWPRIEHYERRAGREVPVIRLTPAAPFGDRVVAVAGGTDAARIESGFDRTLLNLAGFEQYVRVDGSQPEVVATIAEVAARYTSTPESVCFAIWEGHGWAGTSQYSEAHVARSLLGRALAGVRERQERRAGHRWQERERRQLDEQLSMVPRLELPNRSYHLFTGSVEAAAAITAPGAPQLPQLPDLWWPEDLAWFVANDVDVDHTAVGGSLEFILELGEALSGAARPSGPESS